MMKRLLAKSSGLLIAVATPMAMGFTFETDSISGSFDSTFSYGMGVRTESPGCNLIAQGATGHNSPDGCLSPVAGIGDQGNMNYDKGDLFTHYLKGNHELLLKLPADFTFMARSTWIRDFAATDTTGALSAVNVPGVGSDGLTDDARDELKFKARLLDLWISRSFDVGDHRLRARLGNQVINWGESLFTAGGINNTNAYDVMALSRPGTQLKEALLPAPMLSLATGLGSGVNIEAYWQFGWNKTELPPVGSYWSTTQGLGEGMETYGSRHKDARDSGQWGVSLRWQPESVDLNLGLYVMRYHDKLPSATIDAAGTAEFSYLEDRMLYGISANMPVGDWAVGTELSYRPKDAVTLNPVNCLFAGGAKCWTEEKKFQWHLTGIYGLTPSNSPALLDFTGASTGNLLTELVVVKYPDLKDQYDGLYVGAGLNNWWLDPNSPPDRRYGNKSSSGISVDFSLTYENTLLEGWQVTPGIFYSQSLGGRTPSLAATFTEDSSNLNLYLNFARNPASWQVSVNYAKYMGGDMPYDQLLGDRDYVGLVVSRSL